MEPQQLHRLLGHIQKRFPMEQVKEYTIEAGRPDSITKEKLQAIREYPGCKFQTSDHECRDLKDYRKKSCGGGYTTRLRFGEECDLIISIWI